MKSLNNTDDSTPNIDAPPLDFQQYEKLIDSLFESTLSGIGSENAAIGGAETRVENEAQQKSPSALLTEDINILDVLEQELQKGAIRKQNLAESTSAETSTQDDETTSACAVPRVPHPLLLFQWFSFLVDCCAFSFLLVRPFLWYQIVHGVTIPNAKTPFNMVNSMFVAPAALRMLVFVLQLVQQQAVTLNWHQTHIFLLAQHVFSLALYLTNCHLVVRFWVKCVFYVYFALNICLLGIGMRRLTARHCTACVEIPKVS